MLEIGTKVRYRLLGEIREGTVTSYITEDGSDFFQYEIDRQYGVYVKDILWDEMLSTNESTN